MFVTVDDWFLRWIWVDNKEDSLVELMSWEFIEENMRQQMLDESRILNIKIAIEFGRKLFEFWCDVWGR